MGSILKRRARRDEGGAAAVEFALILIPAALAGLRADPVRLVLLRDAVRQLGGRRRRTSYRRRQLHDDRPGPDPDLKNTSVRRPRPQRQRDQRRPLPTPRPTGLRGGARRDRRRRPVDATFPTLTCTSRSSRSPATATSPGPTFARIEDLSSTQGSAHEVGTRRPTSVVRWPSSSASLPSCSCRWRDRCRPRQAWAQKRQVQAGSDLATVAGAGITGDDLPAPSAGKICTYGTGAMSSDQPPRTSPATWPRPGVHPGHRPGRRQRWRGECLPSQLTDCKVSNGEVFYGIPTYNNSTRPGRSPSTRTSSPGQPAEQGRLRVGRDHRHQQSQRGRSVYGRDPLAQDVDACRSMRSTAATTGRRRCSSRTTASRPAPSSSRRPTTRTRQS